MNTQGFTTETWRTVMTFGGRIATEADVQAGRAVFALGDTLNPLAFEEPLPQPVVWTDEETGEDFAALIVQAEQHEADGGQQLQVLGLLLARGRTVVAFTEDVQEVDADDPDWLELLEADLAEDDPDLDEAQAR